MSTLRRQVPPSQRARYQCALCADAYFTRKNKYIRACITDLDSSYGCYFCPYETCPYAEEIEQYADYAEYDKAQKKKIKGLMF